MRPLVFFGGRQEAPGIGGLDTENQKSRYGSQRIRWKRMGSGNRCLLKTRYPLLRRGSPLASRPYIPPPASTTNNPAAHLQEADSFKLAPGLSQTRKPGHLLGHPFLTQRPRHRTSYIRRERPVPEPFLFILYPEFPVITTHQHQSNGIFDPEARPGPHAGLTPSKVPRSISIHPAYCWWVCLPTSFTDCPPRNLSPC